MNDPSLENEYVWIDTFCVDQFAWVQRKKSLEVISFKCGFMSALRSEIGRIGKTVLFLDMWDSLPYVLNQMWVVWEVFSTVAEGASLRVVTRESEKYSFLMNGKVEPFGYCQRVLSRISIDNARARDAYDKYQIFEAIKKSNCSSHEVNERVKKSLQGWIANVSLSWYDSDQIKDTFKVGFGRNLVCLLYDQGMLLEAERVTQDLYTWQRELLGESVPEVLELRYGLERLRFLQQQQREEKSAELNALPPVA